MVAVQMAISPLHSTLSMGGKYGGTSQKIKVECTKASEGVWSAKTSYIFPGNGTETDFSIYFKTDDGTEVTYGHSFKGVPQANYLFNVTGSYAGGFIVGGNFDVTDWEGVIDVEFDFGSDVVPDDEEDDDEDENVETIYSLIKEIKEKFPTKDIWLYTGLTLEQIFPTVVTDDFDINRFYRQTATLMCDVVVDGKYVEELRNITLKWKGSSNQRVIDIGKTVRTNKIVLYND